MKTKILCDVVFPIPSFVTYTYYIPEDIKIKDKKIIGRRIIADFGTQKNKIGVVVDLKENTNNSIELKPIKSLVDNNILFDEEQINTAKKLADFYLYPLGMMLNAFFNIEKIFTFKQGILINQIEKKIKHICTGIPKELLKIINNDRKKFLYVPSSIKEKFSFYKNLILHTIIDGKKSIILFPSVEIILDFWNYIVSEQDIEKNLLNTKIMQYTGKVDMEERYKVWDLFRANHINVILATKIGAFLPFKDVSYIIIDEPDSLGYKNPEAPMYDTSFIVEERSKNYKYKIIYCTFVPSIELKYKNKNVTISDESVLKKNRVKIEIVKKELKNVIIRNLYRFRQTIVISPYRGDSGFYICILCKKIFTASKKETKENFICPYCKSKYYKEYGIGIKKLIEVIKHIDKNLTVEYIDYNTKDSKIAEIINKFNNEKVDVLISTFVIVDYIYRLKFDNVQSIYFQCLDSLLYKPDYMVYERIYRMIKMMEIMLKNSYIENSEILLEIFNREKQNEILLKDYNSFYNSELKLRKELSYPPFSSIIKINFKTNNLTNIKNITGEMLTYLEKIKNIEVFSSEEIEKFNKEYRSSILVKILDEKNTDLNDLINLLRQTIEKNKKIKIYLER